jgi:hypothetical protein
MNIPDALPAGHYHVYALSPPNARSLPTSSSRREESDQQTISFVMRTLKNFELVNHILSSSHCDVLYITPLAC